MKVPRNCCSHTPQTIILIKISFVDSGKFETISMIVLRVLIFESAFFCKMLFSFLGDLQHKTSKQKKSDSKFGYILLTTEFSSSLFPELYSTEC